MYFYKPVFKENLNFSFITFLWATSFDGVKVPSLKIIKNLPETYKKLNCKGEQYQSSGKQNLKTQLDISCYFYITIN